MATRYISDIIQKLEVEIRELKSKMDSIEAGESNAFLDLSSMREHGTGNPYPFSGRVPAYTDLTSLKPHV